MTIKQEILNELLKGYSNPEDLIGKGRIFDELQKRLLETVMKAEMGNHLVYEKNSITRNNIGNSRDGNSKRPIKTKSTELELEISCDLSSSSQNKSIYLAIVINDEGNKKVLGLRVAKNVGANFWLSV